MLFILQEIYIFVYALVGLVSHNESSVHGHESFQNFLQYAFEQQIIKYSIENKSVILCIRWFSIH